MSACVSVSPRVTSACSFPAPRPSGSPEPGGVREGPAPGRGALLGFSLGQCPCSLEGEESPESKRGFPNYFCIILKVYYEAGDRSGLCPAPFVNSLCSSQLDFCRLEGRPPFPLPQTLASLLVFLIPVSAEVPSPPTQREPP